MSDNESIGSLVLLAAVTKNGCLGKDNDLLFHIAEDLARFKQRTSGSVVIMGRKTQLSLPEKYLPNRVNIVVTSVENEPTPSPDVFYVRTPYEAITLALSKAKAPLQDIFVIGGARIYEAFLPMADRMELTEIHENVEGDVYFPEWDRSEWDRRVEAARDTGTLRYDFVTYTRRESPENQV